MFCPVINCRISLCFMIVYICVRVFFFFSSRRRHTRSDRDWSSDVCSSDLLSVPEIAKTLGVDVIVEGSVIREGTQIRVHAQLIRAATDEHIWAEEYQREYRSVLAIEEEVARTIAERIEVSLTPTEQASLASTHAVDPEAHEDYLKGRYYFNQRTEDTLNRSIVYFQQALARDPNYALAYCGLADAYARLGFRGGFPCENRPLV